MPWLRWVTAVDLIQKCLVVDPAKRITIVQFLSHPWITVRRCATAPCNAPH
jgi:serine/threonine protein kinase